MKLLTTILSIIALCVIGCSKADSPAPTPQRLVPVTVAELEASTEFKLDYTTKRGTKFYVRYLDPKAADSITQESPDYKFMEGGSKPYLIAAAYNGRVVFMDWLDTRLRKPDGQYTPEGEELFIYSFKRMSRDSAADWEKLKKEATE